MKHLFYFLLFCSITIQSQDFKHIDTIVSSYPNFKKVEDLASKIATDFTSDENKAKAAFYWLTQNIRYNIRLFYSPVKRTYNYSYSSLEEKQQKLQALKDRTVSKAFITKSGVCEEYAQSFKKICDILGLEAEVIKGYVRNSAQEIGKPKNLPDHAWNAVKLNNKWILLDATWAAGYEYNRRWVKDFNSYYYDISGNKIFKTHFPFDDVWVLRFGRMHLSEFYNQPIYGVSFLASKTSLLSPKTGIIPVNTAKEIVLKFKNLNTSSLIHYRFKGQRFSLKPSIYTVGDITTLTIKNAKKNSYLYLFFNKDVALQFKTK